MAAIAPVIQSGQTTPVTCHTPANHIQNAKRWYPVASVNDQSTLWGLKRPI